MNTPPPASSCGRPHCSTRPPAGRWRSTVLYCCAGHSLRASAPASHARVLGVAQPASPDQFEPLHYNLLPLVRRRKPRAIALPCFWRGSGLWGTATSERARDLLARVRWPRWCNCVHAVLIGAKCGSCFVRMSTHSPAATACYTIITTDSRLPQPRCCSAAQPGLAASWTVAPRACTRCASNVQDCPILDALVQDCPKPLSRAALLSHGQKYPGSLRNGQECPAKRLAAGGGRNCPRAASRSGRVQECPAPPVAPWTAFRNAPHRWPRSKLPHSQPATPHAVRNTPTFGAIAAARSQIPRLHATPCTTLDPLITRRCGTRQTCERVIHNRYTA